MWNPPAEPERDLWWAAQRIAAPDTDDHTDRHQRGVVRLPWTLEPHPAGTLRPAWVCCDPACGGVELGEFVLNLNHGCCKPSYVNGPWFVSRSCRSRGGFHHGPYTAWWEPAGGGL